MPRRSRFKSWRLRKKYKQGEFAQYGFSISGKYKDSTQNVDAIIDALIDIAEKKLKVSLGGSVFSEGGFKLIICKAKGTIRLDERDAIVEEFRNLDILIEEISDLFDLWYEKSS